MKTENKNKIQSCSRVNKITRIEFMKFFEDDEFHNKVTTNDCVNIFRTVLKSSSDLTVKLFNDILSDYNSELVVVDYTEIITLQKQIKTLSKECIKLQKELYNKEVKFKAIQILLDKTMEILNSKDVTL